MDEGSGLHLSAIAARAGVIGDDELRRESGDAYFVLLHICVQKGPRVPQRTLRHLGAVHDTAPFAIDADLTVFPVRKSPGSELPFVSIGRLPGNDIVLPSETVSKFHAYVKADVDGGLLIQDGRSSNGTFVDSEGVARRGEGPPTRLRVGAQVRFGSVSMVFLDLAGTLRLARATAPLARAAS